jgi:hypothetical protein
MGDLKPNQVASLLLVLCEVQLAICEGNDLREERETIEVLNWQVPDELPCAGIGQVGRDAPTKMRTGAQM